MANIYISKQLKAARIAAGLTQKNVYEWLGIGQSTFSAWETGQSEPGIGIFLRLCQKYGIRDIAGHFMPDFSKDTEEALSPVFIKKLRSLSPDGRSAVENCLDFEYRTMQKKRISLRKLRKIPLYTQAATAGLGSYLDDADATVCELEAPEGADFAIRLSGNSMEPLLLDGQIVFVRQQNELSQGDIGIFVCNGESFCKMWDHRSGHPKLLSLNPNYSPIHLTPSDTLRICGKVLL